MDRGELTRRWMFLDYWGFSEPERGPEDERIAYGKALIMAANGDGRLTDQERDWILGYVATGGHSDQILRILSEFDGQGEFEELFDVGINSIARRVCIYDAIRASGSDGELAQGEIDSIRTMAARLEVGAGEVDELISLYREELDLKARRLRAVFKDVPEMAPR